MKRITITITIFAAFFVFGLAEFSVAAPVVWNGPKIMFFKDDFGDWTDFANQDRITDNVWITRQTERGIFNIRQESEHTKMLSPVDTEWATGSAADFASLTFTNWEAWHGKDPLSVLNVPAVVHLISDDIYIDIVFLQWTSGRKGGGFVYERSTVPISSTLLLLATGLGALAGIGSKKFRKKLR
jgi:hypothetical protein